MINLIKKCVGTEKAFFAVVLLFFLFYFILAWFNSLAHDDQEFLFLYNKFGFLGSIKEYYLSWQGRVSAYVFTNLTLIANRFTNGLFIYYILLVILFISGIYFLFVNTFNRLGINYKTARVLLFSAYLFVFFQEIVYDKSTIFWLAASASYYAGLAFLVVGTAIIFSVGTNYFKLVILFIIFLIVGCSLESLALISFFIITGFLAGAFIFKTNKFFYDIKPKVIISIIALSAGIAIMMLCPGLENRRAAFPKPDMISVIKIAANSFYHFYKFMFLPELGKIILFSAPFVYLGHQLKTNNTLPENKSFARTVLIILTLLIVLILLNFLIMAKGTGGMGLPRTLFLIVFFIAVAFAAVAFTAGYFDQVGKSFSQILSWAAIVILLISLSQNYLRSLPESIRYSKSEKNRIEFLLDEKAKGRTEAIVLDSLHYNQYVIYRSDEISEDTSGFWNLTLKKALDIEFNISSDTRNYSEE